MAKRVRGHVMLTMAVLMMLPWAVMSAQTEIVMEEAVSTMLRSYAQRNKNQATVKAWRIQIGSMTDRRLMETEKTRFENLFPHLRVEWIFDNPYYLLRLRDVAYRDKLEILPLYQEIRRRYASALLIIDEVPMDKVINWSK